MDRFSLHPVGNNTEADRLLEKIAVDGADQHTAYGHSETVRNGTRVQRIYGNFDPLPAVSWDNGDEHAMEALKHVSCDNGGFWSDEHAASNEVQYPFRIISTNKDSITDRYRRGESSLQPISPGNEHNLGTYHAGDNTYTQPDDIMLPNQTNEVTNIPRVSPWDATTNEAYLHRTEVLEPPTMAEYVANFQPSVCLLGDCRGGHCFQTFGSYRAHLKNVHNKTNFCPHSECPHPGPFSSAGDVRRHILDRHCPSGDKEYKCLRADCPARVREWNRKDKLRSHNKKYHWKLQCHNCSTDPRYQRWFETDQELFDHANSEHLGAYSSLSEQ